jgi:hypothetical protein
MKYEQFEKDGVKYIPYDDTFWIYQILVDGKVVDYLSVNEYENLVS